MALTAIQEAAVRLWLDGHTGPVVGQAEKSSRNRNRNRICRVPGEEKKTRKVGVFFADLGAQVELRKAIGARDLWQPAKADAIHPEGHDADPGRAVEGVRNQAGRQQWSDGRR